MKFVVKKLVIVWNNKKQEFFSFSKWSLIDNSASGIKISSEMKSINMFIKCFSEFMSFLSLFAYSADPFSCLNVVKKLKFWVDELPIPILQHHKSPSSFKGRTPSQFFCNVYGWNIAPAWT